MNILSAIVPLLVYLLLWMIFYKKQSDWRASFLFAATTWGVLLTAITETLSPFKAISFWPVLGTWSLCLAAAAIYWIRAAGSPKNLLANFQFPGISRFELFLLGGIVFIAGIVGLIAWIAPPNTWDSMTYHMARVMHWIQDGSVADYPTHIVRQLFMNPGSEFIILHFQILSGGDRFANFVQWFSMVGSAIGVTLIARELGADRRGQVFSAAVSMTIPMGILQGSSTQNDYVAAFWLVCLVYFTFKLRANQTPWNALAAGAGLGLAILAKATAYIFAVPFLIWLGLGLFKSGWGKALQTIGIVAIISLALNFGHYLRNYDLFGNPLGLTADVFSTGGQIQTFKYSNDIFTFSSLVSNSVRNIASNLGTPFDSANHVLEQVVDRIHTLIGLSPNDPRTTWPQMDFAVMPTSFSEDSAGNLLQVILIVIAIVLVTTQSKPHKDRFIYCLSLILAFLLFSFYLRWQPWDNRLELPLFLLWSALIGVIMAGFQRIWIANTTMTIVLLVALPSVFLNQSRPILGAQNIFDTSRAEQYFRNDHSLWFSYPRAIQSLSGSQCGQIGLYLDGGSWEYPLWTFLQQELGKGIRIESVNVENVSAKEYSRFPEFTPCAVIVANPLPVDNFQVNGISYSVYQTTKFITVLTPK